MASVTFEKLLRLDDAERSKFFLLVAEMRRTQNAFFAETVKSRRGMLLNKAKSLEAAVDGYFVNVDPAKVNPELYR